MKAKTRNRVLASLLALVMVLGMLPMGALAAWVDDVPLAALPKGEEVVSVPQVGRDSGKTLAGEAYTPADAAAEGKEVHYLAFDAAGFTNGTTATAVTFLSDSGATVTTALATNTLYRIVCNGQVMSGIYTSDSDKVLFRWPSGNARAGNTAYQFKLLAGTNGGYKLQSQHGGALYSLTHEIKNGVTLGNNPALNTYIITTAGEEFYITPVSDGTDGSYYIWWAVEPQQTSYTPDKAEADGYDVHYFVKANPDGWTLSETAGTVTVTTGGNTSSVVTDAFNADTNYQIYNASFLSAPFATGGKKSTAQGSYTAATCDFKFIDAGNGTYKIKAATDGSFMTQNELDFRAANRDFKGVEFNDTGAEFYITPASDPNNGTYYIWYTTEREDPDPGETIEHHTPTEGMNQHYLQYNGSGAWIGGNTDNANIRLDAYDTTYTQYTKADVQSGTYAIYSSRSTEPKWMHVVDDAINRCTNQEDIDAHRFTFTYDAQAHGYTIRSKATGKYLSAQQGSLSMASTGTIFYIDKVQGGNFYHIWWESEIRSGEAISGMFDAAPDNTWVFTGGEDVAGGWAQTEGKRSFMGHFEEYVRWTYGQSSAGGDSTTKERYTVNTAYAGLTLADIVGDWNKYVAKYDPRAAVYMVSAEDKDDASFGAHLNDFIDNATALRSGDGFAVIMKSYDSDLAALNAAVDTVVEGLKSDNGKYSRVVVAATALTDTQMTDDGHPNAAGHLELSKQLVTAACPNSNTGGNFPAPSGGAGLKNLQEVASPASYDKTVVPAVSVTGGAMTITLNGVDAFRYELRLDNGVTISGAGADGSATVTDVPENVSYTLVTRSADGATQYKTVTAAEAELTELQQKLVDKVNDKNTPLTWLFMGDSITHACHWLSGYASVAQLTEDFLGTLGRDKDVIINTAVSSATTASTLANIDYRLKQFPAPDVASIMLGTNDCGGIDAATTYKTNLNSIIAAIREKNADAIIILRSPTGNWTPRAVGPYCEAMKEVAAAQGCIYIDQYTETQGMLDTYRSWIRNNTSSFPNQVYYGNNLHPGAKAQLDMAKMFFKGTGLWDEDNPISNHDYVLTTAETSATSVSGALQRGKGTLTLSVSALGGNLGETTLTATKDGQSWSVTAKAGTNPMLTLPDGAYTVTASAIKTNEAKTVTFASATVEIGEDVPPIETQGYPEADPSKVQNYLDFGSTWVSVTAPAALELYGVSGSVYTKDTDGIDSGVYGIYDPTPGDGGAARWMHVSGDVTNQCGSNPVDHTTDHSFTFTYNAEKKAYTIQSVKTGKYLTQTRSGSQFAVNDTPTWFYVSPVDPENNNGTYYIWWETEPQPGGAIGEMFNAEPGNTWVFTGGVDVAGQFEQTRGRRSFAGQFEEYFRWHFQLNGDENAVGGFSPARQRYVINTAYKGLALNTIVSENGWAERVTDFAPRAVTYMVGKEDLEHEASFETDLAAFIDKATALRENNGFAVIMKSYDSSLSDLNAKVDSVVAGYRTTAARKYSHIVVVNALTLTEDQMTADGHPNADGHMELGRNLAVAMGGTANAFPGNAQNRYTETAMPTFNKTVTPTVAWNDDVMTIGGLNGAFTYQVKLASGVTVSGAGTNTATVTDLPDGAAYSLITRSANGATQYQTVTGLVGGGEVPAKTGEQKKIADLLAAHPDDSLTWLFVGDSITHGILVSGYDSAPQLMEEYLDTIGRTKDVVVNAGVSSATTASTLNAKAYRLEPFTADVAIIMLGTNDCSTNLTGNKAISKETYKENLGKIVDAIRANNPNAVIVMRTPTGFWDDKHPQMSEYVAQLTAFAEERGLILVDQMTATQHAINTYPWSKSGAQFYGDNLHPGVVGQLKIFQMLIREMGLWNDDNEICNLDYLWDGMTSENSATGVSSGLRVNGSQLSLNVSALGANLGRTTLTATNGAGQSWSVLAEAGETPSLILPDGAYTVTASSVKTNEAKTVTFASETVEIDANAEPSKMPAPAEPKAYEYVLTSGELTPGVYAIVAGTSEDENNYPRSMHYWTDSRTNLDQCSSGVPANAEKVAFSDVAANHLWNVEKKANGKYTFAAVAAAGNYLTGGAGTLTRGTEATEFTVAARAGGGYDLSWENGGTTYYLNWAQTHSPRWYGAAGQYQINLYRQTEVALEVAQTEFKGTNDRPMDPNDPDSYYRIPSLTTLSNGWIMATSDIRWFTTFDSPNNLDTIVSISKDGGETWEYEVVNYLADYAAPNKNLAVTYGANKGGSASFIDPAVVQSKVTDEVYLLVDLQPPYVNGGKIGTGFDGEGRLLVGYIPVANGYTMDNGHNNDLKGYTYDYYVDINSAEAGAEQTVNMTGLGGAADQTVKLWPICAAVDDSQTGYYADAFFNTYYDYGEDGFKPVIAVQHDSAKSIHNNLFYTQSDWKAFPTAFIMLRKATVTENGLAWGAPYLLNAQIKHDNEHFIGVCPGRGTVATVNGKERIIFPLYDSSTGNELASVIYSDDGGATWTRGARTPDVTTNNTGKSSESQIVVLPDGNGGTFLRMYSRNGRPTISYADSHDGGATWSVSVRDSALNANNQNGQGCMVSFINVAGVLRGPDGTVYDNLIMGSYPQGTANGGTSKRTNGAIRIGSYSAETGSVTWLNEEVTRYRDDYIYSCLTQKLDGQNQPTGSFALLYETVSDVPNSAGNDFTDIRFDSFTAADIMGENWDWALTEDALSPIEPVVPTLPEGAVWAYVSFTSGTPGPNVGWGTSAEPYSITLYKESATNTNGEKVTSLTNGVYKLWSGTRWMHVDNTDNKDQTNQCTGNDNAHNFRFTSTGDGYYTIKSVASTSQDRYLNIGELGSYNQLPCTEIPTKFVVEKVDGQDGVFTIKTAVYPAIQFKSPVTTGINQTLIYQQVTERGAVKGDGTMYAVIAPNVNGGTRAMWATDSATDNYMATLNSDETRVTLDGDANRQLWGLQPTEGGYKVISRQHRKCLTTTASGKHLALNATGSVFTVETGAESGTFYLKSGTQYLSWNDGWKMASAPFALKLYTPVLETLDLTGREEAQLLFSGTGSDQPCKPGLGGSNQFRIPALITLTNGWLVAAADVRWSHGVDNPSNLETIVSVSKDNGQTWDWEFVNYFGDYDNTVSDRLSTAFIDPALIQDPATGKVWMLVDVTSADGKGTSGSTGFDGQDRLLVAHVPAYVDQKAPGDASLYTYYVSKAGTEFTVNGAAVTLYPIESSTGATDCDGLYVDAFYNIYHVNGDTVEREMVVQHGSDKIVQDNLFFRQSEWRVFPTCYLMLRSAEVNETTGKLEWSDPMFTNLRGTTPGAGAAFFGAGPGRGFIADSGRILFTAYDNVGGEHASAIYSDDHGATWQRGGRAQNTVGNKTSESQIIRLPDGSLRMYSRNVNSRYVSYSDSTDGGETWGVTKLDEGWGYCSNCMISVINVEGTLTAPDGTVYDNIIVASYPEGNGQYTNAYAHRNTGVVRFGSVGTDADHTVTWLGEVNKLLGTADFVYSCLTQIQVDGVKTDRFGWLYEPYATRGHGINDVTYKELTVAEVLGEGWALTVKKPDEPEEPKTYTVTFTGEGVSESPILVEEGSTVDLPEPVREGYTFDGWFNGETQFTADMPVNENLTLTAHWTEIIVIEPNDWGNVALAVTPNPVAPGGILQVTVTNVPENAAGLTLTLEGNEIALNRGEDGVYTGTVTAPDAAGARTLAFVLSAEEYAPKLLQAVVTVSQPTPPTPSGGGGGTRPTTPVEEDLNDPDVPLANGPMLYEDVKAGDWFYDAAKFVASAGLMMGVSETRFAPSMNTTRGMIVTILYRMEKEPGVDPATFLDVPQDAWYSAGAAWGEMTGVAKGMSDGNFHAMDDVTREQLAAFLFRFAEHRGYDVSARGDLTVFHDGAAVSGWAEDAMRWAVATGLITGKGAGGLDPLSTATRGEVATILMRFCENIEKN